MTARAPDQIPLARLTGFISPLLLILGCPVLLFPEWFPLVTALVLGMLALTWAGEALLRRPWPASPFSGVLLLLLGMVLVGILITPYPDLTLPKATGIVLGIGLFRSVAGIRGQKSHRLALALFLLAAMAVWGTGFIGTTWSFKIPALQGFLDRLPDGGILLPESARQGVNPNELGGILALLLPVPVALAVQGRLTISSLPRRLFLALLATVWVATLVLTQSRSGWAGGLIGLVAMGALAGFSGQRRQQRWAGAALLLFIIAILTVFLAWWGPERVGSFLYDVAQERAETAVGSITMQGRLEIWSRAAYAIQDFPFTGCGLGTFRQVVRVLYPLFTIPFKTDIAHVHNVFLQMAVDLGLPGLVAYLALLGIAGVVGWQVARRDGAERWLALGILGGLVGYHIYGLADALALGSRPHFLFWWMLGLLAAAAGQAEGQRTQAVPLEEPHA